METAQRLDPDTTSRRQSVHEHRDWDPFVVWERQISGSSTTASAGHHQPESDWNPFRVWADHFGGSQR